VSFAVRHNWREHLQSLGAAAIGLSQDIIENACSHFNQVKERQADLSFAANKEDVVLFEVLAFEYFLLAHPASCTQLERQGELLTRVAENLWIYVSSRQSQVTERLAFQEFLDRRFASYQTCLGGEDFLVRLADALLENLFPDQPQDGGLLAYFAMIAGTTSIANKRFFDRIAQTMRLA